MTDTVIDRLAYRPKTFAELTGLSLSFVKLEIYRGNLKAIKKGAATLIPVEAAREYLEGKETAQEEAETLASAA